MLFFPFVYCIDIFICYYPPTDHLYLEDQSVADILALNITDHIALTGHSFNDWKQTMGFYYIIIACTIAYIIIITLAFLMDKFLQGRLKLGASSAQTVKMVEMNKQISRNLIIQASMPFFIYLSMLFLLAIILFKINVSRWDWLQYYNMLTSIPMFLPIPSMALYIAEIVTIVRHKKFHNSFYALFVMRAIPDLVYVLDSFYCQRLPSIIGSLLYPIYSQLPTWFYAISLFFTGHTFQANNLVTIFILFNRLTAIIMPMKHEKLWRKLLPLLTIFVLCVPILTCWPVLKLDGIILLNNPNSTTDQSFVMYEAGDAPYISYITYISTVFSAIFMIICVLINICTFVAYKLHMKKANTNENNFTDIKKKLLVYALATFLGHALVASLFLIILITNIDDPKTKTMLYVYYTLIMDIGTVLLSSCLLLWASGTFRQQLLKDFGIIRINNQDAYKSTGNLIRHLDNKHNPSSTDKDGTGLHTPEKRARIHSGGSPTIHDCFMRSVNGNNFDDLERKLLIYAVATFLGHAFVASLLLILIITNIDDPKTKTMLYVYYTLIMDTVNANVQQDIIANMRNRPCISYN
uniref:Serpentine receptor class gamma n=1 Tax=Globodera rostochiensis TaxID=31243 RepID=A0A914H463_GLORO